LQIFLENSLELSPPLVLILSLFSRSRGASPPALRTTRGAELEERRPCSAEDELLHDEAAQPRGELLLRLRATPW
ncbi:unnamed protein product, partial [Urochloa humidicola]